jgi:hypothetical protein
MLRRLHQRGSSPAVRLLYTILGAVLFRQSQPHHFRLTGAIVLAYLFVSLLHGAYASPAHHCGTTGRYRCRI